MSKKKTQKFTVYLLKNKQHSLTDYLREDSHYQEFEIDDEIDIVGKIIIGERKTKEPTWKEYLELGSKNNLGDLINASNRALIIVEIKNHIFAYTFGYGRYLLKEEFIVFNFGFRVAINAVEPDGLRSIDITNLEELSVSSKIQTSKASSKETFGIDILNDLMKSVTGVPRNKRFTNIVTGRDAVAFNGAFEFKEIKRKSIILKYYYQSKKYVENFEWIDNLFEEKDPNTIQELQNKLVEDIKNRNFNKMHLAPLDLIDWSNITGIQYKAGLNKKEEYNDIDIQDYTNNIKNNDNLTYTELKKHKIILHYSDSDEFIPKWKIDKSINYETEHNSYKYVFTLGKWYRIDKKFAQEITEYVKNMDIYEKQFPDCENGEREDHYNIRVADTSDSYILLDKFNVRCEYARTSIEPCDILVNEKDFIHVKKRHDSANLSHLFSQGRVSAESFKRDEHFRKNLKEKIKEKYSIDINYDPKSEIKTNEYTVVFAIIEKSDKNLYESLPFFSLLNLQQSAEVLKMFEYKVKIKKIKWQ